MPLLTNKAIAPITVHSTEPSSDRLAVFGTQNRIYLDDAEALNQPKHPEKCYDKTDSRQSSFIHVLLLIFQPPSKRKEGSICSGITPDMYVVFINSYTIKLACW